MPSHSRPTPYEPRVGDTVRDAETLRVGKVMGHVGPHVQLRPIGGGVEWDARPDALTPVSTSEALSPAVSAANARSRGELR